MSYDVYIRIDTGGELLAEVCDVGNMTSNVGPMYYKSMPGPYPGGGRYGGYGDPDPDRGGLTGLSGLPCSEASPILAAGIEYMRTHEDEMVAMEPENKWGNYPSALAFLEKIKAACDAHPKARLAVGW